MIDYPTEFECARDDFEDAREPLRDGVYSFAGGEYVAVAEYDGEWLAVGEDGVVERYSRRDAVPVLRRADCLEREHKSAASLARVIACRRGNQLRAFARDRLRKLLAEAEL